MADIIITERLLMDAGGWQAMKHARALFQMGRVTAAEYRPPLLQGRVRDGETEYRCGLKIRTPTDIENLCSCRQSRDYGAICAHSLAVGLAWMKPNPSPAGQTPVSSRSAGTVPQAAAVGPELVAGGDPPIPAIELHVVMAPNFLATWSRDQVTLGFEVVQAGRRILASALPVTGRFRCSPEEQQLLDAGRQLADGRLPGMLSVSRGQFLKLLPLMTRFPRLTLGRRESLNVSTQAVRPELSIRSYPAGALDITARPWEGAMLIGPESAWLYR
jgi:hypothetical protein